MPSWPSFTAPQRTRATTSSSAIPQSGSGRCLFPRKTLRRAKPMARSDEPVDFWINLEPSHGDVPTFMEESEAGQAKAKIEEKKLMDVVAAHTLLQQEGVGVYEFAQLGQKLFGDLFADAQQRKIFVRACDTAEREERPLRILIRLPHDSSLGVIPWELLHDGDKFLAKDPRCAVVRYLYDPKHVPSFEVVPP